MDSDAPQISTLRAESTPPPAPTRTTVARPRVKLVVHSNATPTAPEAVSSSLARPLGANGHVHDRDSEGDEEEEEDEEDQLIDDDEVEVESVTASLNAVPLGHASTLNPAPSMALPIVIPGGRALKRGRGGSRGGARGKRGGRASSPMNRQTPEIWDASSAGTGTPIATPLPPKKRQRKSGPPVAAVRKAIASSFKVAPSDDGVSVSEVVSITAPSSPVLHETILPVDVDMAPPPALPQGIISLEDAGPIPQYPLPQRPFVVQPIPKIATGFAPTVPLDKSARRVRHWRVANREIRGIAGGRWFARSWVGNKESEVSAHTQEVAEKERERLAVNAAAAAAAVAPPFTTTPKPLSTSTNGTPMGNGNGSSGLSTLALPKLSAVTISAGIGTGKSSKSKATKSDGSFASRSASLVPGEPAQTRAPSKMRNSIAASEVVEIMDVDVELATATA